MGLDAKRIRAMPEISEEDFQKRAWQIRAARKIFGHMTDYNITVAYQLYREIFEEKDLPELLSYSKAGRKHHIMMRKYVRPRCPKCGKPLVLRHICTRQGPANVFGYKSAWECWAEDCYYEEFSKRDVRWITRHLKLKGEL